MNGISWPKINTFSCNNTKITKLEYVHRQTSAKEDKVPSKNFTWPYNLSPKCLPVKNSIFPLLTVCRIIIFCLVLWPS